MVVGGFPSLLQITVGLLLLLELSTKKESKVLLLVAKKNGRVAGVQKDRNESLRNHPYSQGVRDSVSHRIAQ